MKRLASLVCLAAPAVLLAGCSTVKLPSADFLKLPDFRENIDALDDAYPSAEELPNAPEGVRSARDWDRSATELQKLGDNFEVPADGEPLDDGEIEDELRALQAYALEYQKDDPQEDGLK